MTDRLDYFLEQLVEQLQPHGGCQCGCFPMVLAAVSVARAKLEQYDEVHAYDHYEDDV